MTDHLVLKLPINHGKQTVKLKIDFCQQIMMCWGRVRKQVEPNDKTAFVLGQRGCSRRNPVKLLPELRYQFRIPVLRRPQTAREW